MSVSALGVNGASLTALQDSSLEDRLSHLHDVQTISVWLGDSQQHEQPRETAESEDKGIGAWGWEGNG